MNDKKWYVIGAVIGGFCGWYLGLPWGLILFLAGMASITFSFLAEAFALSDTSGRPPDFDDYAGFRGDSTLDGSFDFFDGINDN